MDNMTDTNSSEVNRVATGRIPLGGRGAGRAKKVTVWFAPKTHDRITTVAKKNGRTRSDIVREAVDAHLASLSPEDMAELEAGLTVLEQIALDFAEAGMLGQPEAA